MRRLRPCSTASGTRTQEGSTSALYESFATVRRLSKFLKHIRNLFPLQKTAASFAASSAASRIHGQYSPPILPTFFETVCQACCQKKRHKKGKMPHWTLLRSRNHKSRRVQSTQFQDPTVSCDLQQLQLVGRRNSSSSS